LVSASIEEVAEQFVSLCRRLRRRSGTAVTDTRYSVLRVLMHTGPARMNVVAARLGVTPRAMTSLADALEADGYLRREPDPHDRRAQLLRITAAGIATLRTAHHQRMTLASSVFTVLSAAERRTLAELLSKVAAADNAPDAQA
jgi:DNA-binding MarR family transcriptional regulator